MTKRDSLYSRYTDPDVEDDEYVSDERTERKKVAWKEQRRKQVRYQQREAKEQDEE